VHLVGFTTEIRFQTYVLLLVLPDVLHVLWPVIYKFISSVIKTVQENILHMTTNRGNEVIRVLWNEKCCDLVRLSETTDIC
jgi:hypothetical protein